MDTYGGMLYDNVVFGSAEMEKIVGAGLFSIPYSASTAGDLSRFFGGNESDNEGGDDEEFDDDDILIEQLGGDDSIQVEDMDGDEVSGGRLPDVGCEEIIEIDDYVVSADGSAVGGDRLPDADEDVGVVGGDRLPDVDAEGLPDVGAAGEGLPFFPEEQGSKASADVDGGKHKHENYDKYFDGGDNVDDRLPDDDNEKVGGRLPDADENVDDRLPDTGENVGGNADETVDGDADETVGSRLPDVDENVGGDDDERLPDVGGDNDERLPSWNKVPDSPQSGPDVGGRLPDENIDVIGGVIGDDIVSIGGRLPFFSEEQGSKTSADEDADEIDIFGGVVDITEFSNNQVYKESI